MVIGTNEKQWMCQRHKRPCTGGAKCRCRRRRIGRARLATLAAIATAVTVLGAARWAVSAPGPVLISVQTVGGVSRIMAAHGSEAGSPFAPSLYAEADPEVSFDGKRILFAGKRGAGDTWQVWESDRGGGGLRQLTRAAGDASQPHYLPDGKILYRVAMGATNALYSAESDGAKPTRLTYNVDPLQETSILPDGRILASLSGRWCTLNQDGTGISPVTGDLAPAHHAEAPTAATPLATAPRPVPTGHASVIDPTKKSGKLFCLNSYLSDKATVAGLPDGAMRRVRVWTRSPQEKILGEAPIEPDGSFALELPPNVPLRVDALDAGGKVLASDPVWLWLRPNETRGCIGCHEDRDLTPENRVPDAIRRLPNKLGLEGGAR